ncbi:MAG TPA: DUF2971 domain-containing protein [Allosphingosinicella sp.]|nr:DUF2971 domain-containing protein [Allosphingosinicella sp.]
MWQQILIRSLFHYSAERLDIERAFLIKHEHVPNRLFKYRNFNDYHLDALENDQLWMSSPDRFNDPFDTAIYFNSERFEMEDQDPGTFVAEMKAVSARSAAGEAPDIRPVANPIRTGDWLERVFGTLIEEVASESREALRAFIDAALGAIREAGIRRMSDYLRRGMSVLSLSENPASVLMWSHYSDSHRGFCIEYDLAALPYSDLRRRLCFPVFYRRKRTDATRYLAKQLRDFNNLFAHYLCLLKSDEWSYEREWRIVYAAGPDEPNRPVMMPAPRSLILGANVSAVDRERAAVFCETRSIPLRIASQNLDTFRIDIVEVED